MDIKKKTAQISQKTQGSSEQHQYEQEELIAALLSTIHHYFGSFPYLFANVDDPRDPKDTTYSIPALGFVGTLMYIFRLGARRQIGLLLRNWPSIENFKNLFNVDRVPHGDTLNDAFSKLKPEQVQDVVTKMTETLIRKKVLYPYRLFKRFFIVAIDGTGVITFSERHCPHCLTRTSNGKTTYYHNVLEAKLITANGFAFSLMTEFIENTGKNPTKQDCELKAFYRLAKRLKKRFPRLPILLTMDGLFAGGPTFNLCWKYGWSFMIVLTDKDLPSINKEFEALSKLDSQNKLSWRTGKDAMVKQSFKWVNDISYVDSNSKEHTLSVVECIETKPDKAGKNKSTKFKWITDCNVSSKNVISLANKGGRARWKIENEGFNEQKNGGYELEHSYTNDPNSAKIFYFLLQIAHMLTQLLHKGSLLKKSKFCFGSIKNMAFRLFEAWRNTTLNKDTLESILQRNFQIRLDTS